MASFYNSTANNTWPTFIPFLKVNGVLDQLPRGYNINEENAAIPPKRFLSCATCGKPLRGYIVKKKNIHYYKCNTKACNNNKNADQLNKRFASILEYFKIDLAKDAIKFVREQAITTFNQNSIGKQDAY